MTKPNLHKFKLSLPEKIYKEVNDLSRIFGFSMERTIIFILETTLPIFYKRLQTGKKYHHDYTILGKTKNVFIKLDRDFYFKIHRIYAFLNFYSKASVMRKCLKFFVWKFNRYYNNRLNENFNYDSILELTREEQLILENLI